MERRIQMNNAKKIISAIMAIYMFGTYAFAADVNDPAVTSSDAEATAIPIFTAMPSEPAETMPQSTAAATGSPTPTETVVPSAQPSSSPSCTDPDMLVNVYRKVNGQYTAVYSGRLGDYTGSDAWSHIDYGDLAGLSVFNWADMDTVIILPSGSDTAPLPEMSQSAPLFALGPNNTEISAEDKAEISYMYYVKSIELKDSSGNIVNTVKENGTISAIKISTTPDAEYMAKMAVALYNSDGSLYGIHTYNISADTDTYNINVPTGTAKNIKVMIWVPNDCMKPYAEPLESSDRYTVKITCTENRIYTIPVICRSTLREYMLKYDTSYFDIEDICKDEEGKTTSVGTVNDKITVTDVNAGNIGFTYTGNAQCVDRILLRAKRSGNTSLNIKED